MRKDFKKIKKIVLIFTYVKQVFRIGFLTKNIAEFIKEKNKQKFLYFGFFIFPILYKNKRTLFLRWIYWRKINSICSFIKSKSHPFHSWRIKKTRKFHNLSKMMYSERQDLPTSYNHYHYVCAFRVKEISKLNSELINPHTFPLILNNKTQSKLVEIDTSDDLKI